MRASPLYALRGGVWQVDVESEFSRDRLAWLRGLVAPTLEVAYVVACCLTRLLDADTDGEDCNIVVASEGFVHR